jgi:branched-chain amino acid transport system ATP-binding protein
MINAQGVPIFMVEQNANLALQIANRGYVLQNGRIVLEGPAQALLDSAEIQEAYLGQRAAQIQSSAKSESGGNADR